MKVQNKGGKGNPNHSDKTGEFISADEQENKEEKETGVEFGSDEQDVGTFEISFDESSADDWLSTFDGGLTKKEKIQESRNILGSNEQFLDLTNYNEIQLTKEEKVDLINSSTFGYEKEYLENLDDAEIEAIYSSECIVLAPKQLKQKLALIDEEKKKLENDKQYELYNEFKGPTPSLYGVWQSMARVEDYPEKIKKDETGTSPVDRKRAYYEEIINNEFSFEDEVQDAKDKLADLNSWIEKCEEYYKVKNTIDVKYSEKFAELDTKYTELKELEGKLNSEEYLSQVDKAKKFLENYQDKNSAYSDARKNAALWFKGGYYEANAYLAPKMAEKWENLKAKEKNIFTHYTSNGFSRFNKPLRGIKHDPTGYSFNSSTGTFSEAVDRMTNAIDKCTWDEDIWVQRGIDDSNLFLLPGEVNPHTLQSMTEQERNQLVGTSFKEKGFCSCGAGRNTGFTGKDIIFNIYCPAGTKMVYIAPYSNYKTENEMILQRGYSYKITKVEKKGGMFYIDCEVVLGSDDTKPVGNALKEIGNKYYYAPRGLSGEEYE